MTYRNPADIVREKTETKPAIHEERGERSARLEAQREQEFQDEISPDGPDLGDNAEE